MSILSRAAGILAVSLASAAPFQCGSGSPDNQTHEPSGGDAIYDLAQDFHAKGNEPAARDALKYLIDHFPSNRHVPAAKAELEGSAPPAASK
jgi:hypothetical protein